MQIRTKQLSAEGANNYDVLTAEDGEWFPSPSLVNVPHLDWHINFSTGNDSGPGTAAEPLLTFGELARRFRRYYINANCLVTIDSTGSASPVDHLYLYVQDGVTLRFYRPYQLTGSTVSITGVTDRVPASNQRGVIQNGGSLTWNGTDNLRFILQSGTNVGKRLFRNSFVDGFTSSTQSYRGACFSFNSSFALTVGNPQIGDTIQQESFGTSISALFVRLRGLRPSGTNAQPGRVVFENFDFSISGTVNATHDGSTSSASENPRIVFLHCSGRSTKFVGTKAAFFGCEISGALFYDGSDVMVSACNLGGFSLYGGSRMVIRDAVQLGGVSVIHENSLLILANAAEVEISNQLDWDTHAAVVCGTNGQIRCRGTSESSLTSACRWWGQQADYAFAFRMHSGSGMVYGNLPQITGFANACNVAGTTVAAFSSLPSANTNRGAFIVPYSG